MSSVVDNAIYLKTARPIGGRRLEAILDNGSRVTIDLAPLIERHEGYWRLKHERYFRMVSVDQQGVICWSEGEDVAPESLGKYIV